MAARAKKKYFENKTNLVCDRCVLQYTRRAISMKPFLSNIQRFARIIKFPTKRSEITNIKMLSTYPWLYINILHGCTMINNILYEMYECDLNFEVDAVLYMIINSKITYNSTLYEMYTHITQQTLNT